MLKKFRFILLITTFFFGIPIKSGQTLTLASKKSPVKIVKIENKSKYNLILTNHQNGCLAILGPEEYDTINFEIDPVQSNILKNLSINNPPESHFSIYFSEPKYKIDIQFLESNLNKRMLHLKISNNKNNNIFKITVCYNEVEEHLIDIKILWDGNLPTLDLGCCNS